MKIRIEQDNKQARWGFALAPIWTVDGYMIWLRPYAWRLSDEGGRECFSSARALYLCNMREDELIKNMLKANSRNGLYVPPKVYKHKKPIKPLEKINNDEGKSEDKDGGDDASV